MARGSAIDVYWFDLDDAAPQVARFHALLDQAERIQAVRFRFARDRRRFIVRRGQLRVLLGGYLGCAPEAVRLAYNRFGKPASLTGAPRFNVSHSHGLALYAIAADREVGCDLERRDLSFDVAPVAERFFSAGEVRALRALAPAHRTEGFFNCWTRKEAYVKACACGLNLPLDGFEVSLAPDAPAALLSGCDGWSVAAFEPRPGFHAAVVAEGSDWRLAFRSAERALSEAARA